jgi:hypothetical protein
LPQGIAIVDEYSAHVSQQFSDDVTPVSAAQGFGVVRAKSEKVDVQRKFEWRDGGMAIRQKRSSLSVSAQALCSSCFEFGGGGEIRTHGRRKPSLVFKTSALNHSATPPVEARIIPKSLELAT